MSSFKAELTAHCQAILGDRIRQITTAMEELKTAMETETKSTAGDKHETARARMQAELEKLGWQLSEWKAQDEAFRRLEADRVTEAAGAGSLVYTDRGIFFILVPLGKTEWEGAPVYVISPASPIAQKMMGCKAGETFEQNTTRYTIQTIQ
jgi:arginyl-tRNA synthetase